MSSEQDTQSVIGTDVEITGTVKSSGSVKIEGKLEGDLNCSADAVIGKSATIKGNLSVNSITVEGTVQGNIVAKDKIEMKSTAKVTGDISARRLAVEDGVTFVGKSEVNPAKAAAATPPSAPRSEAAEPKPDESKAAIFQRR